MDFSFKKKDNFVLDNYGTEYAPYGRLIGHGIIRRGDYRKLEQRPQAANRRKTPLL